MCVVGSSTDNEWTHPHGIKETFASTARLSLVTGRKQNPTFTWWLRASRGGAGTSRPSRSFPLLSVWLLLGYLSSCIRVFVTINEREPILRKTVGTGFSKNLRTSGYDLSCIFAKVAREDQRSFATILESGVNVSDTKSRSSKD